MKKLIVVFSFLFSLSSFAVGLPDVAQSMRVSFPSCHPNARAVMKQLVGPAPGYDTLQILITSALTEKLIGTSQSTSDGQASLQTSNFKIQVKIPAPAFDNANVFLTSSFTNPTPLVLSVPAMGANQITRVTPFGQTLFAGGLEQLGLLGLVDITIKCLGGIYSVQSDYSGQITQSITDSGAAVTVTYKDLL